MICLIVAACLAFVGSALGQCSSNSQQDNCTSSFGISLGNHVGNQQLICGDLTTVENCILNISCLAFETRYEFVGQARSVVASLNVSCPTSFPLPSTTRQPGCASNSELDTCSTAFSLDTYSHLNNPTLVCEDLANLESCVASISCLTTARKNELYAQARSIVSGMNITCPTDSPWQTTLPATDIPWLTTREYANCYSLAELDTCTQNFRDGVNAHYPNSGLVCSDVAMFSNCIWRVSCLKTEERYQLILDAKASVNGFNIFCDSIGPDDGGNISGANLTANKSIFSHLLVLGVMVVLFLKYN